MHSELRHDPRNHPVERRPVEEAVAHEVVEPVRAQRRQRALHLDQHHALRRFQLHPVRRRRHLLECLGRRVEQHRLRRRRLRRVDTRTATPATCAARQGEQRSGQRHRRGCNRRHAAPVNASGHP